MKRKTLNCFAGIFMFTAAAFFSITSIIRPLAVSADTIITNAPTTGTLTITKRNMTQTAVKGAKYTAYKIMSLTPGKNPGEYAAYAITDAYKEALGGAAPVTPDSLGNYSAAQIESLLPKLENAATKDTAKKESAATNDSGSTVFTLETGWYLIMETETPVGAVASLPFLVAVPSTNNITSPGGTAITGTEWDYSIEASQKAPLFPLTKTSSMVRE